MFGHLEIVKLLLQNRIEINKAKSFFVAGSYGYIEIVEYVLASGKEVNLAVKKLLNYWIQIKIATWISW